MSGCELLMPQYLQKHINPITAGMEPLLRTFPCIDINFRVHPTLLGASFRPRRRIPSQIPTLADGPYPTNSSLQDSIYTGGDAYALRILDTQQIATYGAGLYSFFNGYVGTCFGYPTPEDCQTAICTIRGSTSHLKVFMLSTVDTIN